MLVVVRGWGHFDTIFTTYWVKQIPFWFLLKPAWGLFSVNPPPWSYAYGRLDQYGSPFRNSDGRDSNPVTVCSSSYIQHGSVHSRWTAITHSTYSACFHLSRAVGMQSQNDVGGSKLGRLHLFFPFFSCCDWIPSITAVLPSVLKYHVENLDYNSNTSKDQCVQFTQWHCEITNYPNQ